MAAELRWNRLMIAAETEEEFLQAVFDYFPQLLQLPYDDVELDITGTPDISEDSFRSIAIKLIGGEAADKKMRIRIPPSADRYFRHANLYRMVDIDVVTELPASTPAKAGDVAKRIASGQFERVEAQASEDFYVAMPADEAPPKSRKQSTVKAGPAFLLDMESGQRHPLADSVIVGRESPADLVFQVPTISKRHFMIRRQEAGYVVEDLRSTNGTYLNGLPVHEPVPLRDGDEIVVAITLKHPKGARIFRFTTRAE
jgi:predicted component of type VI protein secretion system